MANRSQSDDSSAPRVARFLGEKRVVGGGALLRGGLVLTCAHVVNAALGRKSVEPEPPKPEETVRVDFPLQGVGPIDAHVVAWAPLGGIGSGDLALVKLAHDPQLRPLRLVSRLRRDGLSLFGFPDLHADGVWKTDIVAVGAGKGGWEQLAARGGEDYRFQGGFSGCPVVIGDDVVATFAQAEKDAKVDAGLCIPARLAAQVLGEPLASLLAVDIPPELEALLELPLSDAGDLPTVSEIDMYDIGVSRSRYVTREHPDPKYVPRLADAELERALTAQEPFILLEGDSKAGKSRTAFELLRRCLPDAAFAVPDGTPSAPAQLAKLGLPTSAERIVVWLDDLDRFLAPNGLDLRVLSGLEDHDPPVTILATIQAQRRQAVLDTEGDLARKARTVLDKAYEITLSSTLKPTEQAAAEVAYPKERFRDRGIGEQLVAAREMEGLYRAARKGAPAGWAVVQAAVDWRRAGVRRPIPRPVLRELFDSYLFKATQALDATDELFATGLAWARTEVAGSLALLERKMEEDGQETGWVPFDYIVASADDESNEIPRWTWTQIVKRADDDELLGVALEAFTRSERGIARDTATRVWNALKSEVEGSWAAVLLGDLEIEEANEQAAIEWFEWAIDHGHPDVRPVAQTDLGGVRLNRGEAEPAVELLEAAMASGDPEILPQAQTNLGAALYAAAPQERERARQLLEAAIESGVSGVVPLAKANLAGLILTDPADRERAIALLEEVLASGEPRALPVAQANLGGLLIASRDPDDWMRARTLLEEAMASAPPRVVALAQANLGTILLRFGEHAQARDLLETALAHGDPSIVPTVEANLGGMLMSSADEDERARARTLLESAASSGEPRAVAQSQLNLALLLAREHSREEERIRELFEASVETADPDLRPLAQGYFGVLLAEDGEPERAEPLLEAAVASGDQRILAPAQTHLASLLMARGEDAERALELTEAALASGDPRAEIRAKTNLGALLLQAPQPDYPRAMAVLADVLADPRTPLVQRVLAQTNLAAALLDTGGDRARARELLGTALECGHPGITAIAQVTLGAALVQDGETVRAHELLAAAVASSDPRAVPIAQATLGALLVTEDPAHARTLLEAAVVSNDPRAVHLAQATLGALVQQEDPERAAALLEAAIAPAAPAAARALAHDLRGDRYQAAGDRVRAEEEYRAAIALGQHMSDHARIDLALMLRDTGGAEEACRLLSDATRSGDEGFRAMAGYVLGDTLAGVDDVAGAAEAYDATIACGLPQWSVPAQIDRARLHWLAGEIELARSLFEAASHAADAGLAATAQVRLGDMCFELHDAAGAEAAYTAARELGDDVRAGLGLAKLHLEAGEPERARPLAEAAADDPSLAGDAFDLLGDIWRALGAFDAAADAYRAAIDSGAHYHADVARLDLGVLRWQIDGPDAARELLEDVENPDLRPVAHALLGDVQCALGDAAAARHEYEVAARDGTDKMAADARERLAELDRPDAPAMTAERARNTFLG